MSEGKSVLCVNLTPLQVETMIDILTDDIRAAAESQQFEWIASLAGIGLALRLAQAELLGA